VVEQNQLSQLPLYSASLELFFCPRLPAASCSLLADLQLANREQEATNLVRRALFCSSSITAARSIIFRFSQSQICLWYGVLWLSLYSWHSVCLFSLCLVAIKSSRYVIAPETQELISSPSYSCPYSITSVYSLYLSYCSLKPHSKTSLDNR